MCYDKNNSNITNDKYCNGYSIIDWWNDNLFTQYISDNYPTISNHLKMACQTLCKRTLPSLNFNETFAHIICDSLNAFVKYTITFHDIIHKIIKSMSLAGHKQNQRHE